MSSVERGDAFENRVFEALKQELAEDRLGLSPSSARPYKRKGYYSRDRDNEVIVDVSIEVWLPGADRWSMLWVCECKDYSGAIPVNDVEEFKAKLDQIAGANKKGVIATSGALQQSALNYARANGIGVVRLLPDDQVHHVIYHMTPDVAARAFRLDAAEFARALTDPRFVAHNRGFYAASDGYIFGNWTSLLRRHFVASKQSL